MLAQKIKAKYPQYAGLDDATLESRIVARYPQYASMVSNTRQQPQQKTIGGFLSNIGSSAMNFVGDTASGIANVFNPDMEKNTVANLGRLGAGVVQKLDPTDVLGTGYEKNAEAVGGAIYDRYGTMENIGNTLYNDPVGAIGDVAGAISGGAGLVGKGARLAGMGNLANTATRVGAVASALDPISLAGRATGVARGAAGALGSRAAGAAADLGADLTRRSIKASGSQAAKFLEQTGMRVEDFLTQNNITGGASTQGMSQLSQAMQPLQDSYDALTRTGKQIIRREYAQSLLDRAIELEKMTDDPSARSLAKKLFDEAVYQESKLSPLTDTQLTATKAKAFENASKGALANPLEASFDSEIGRAAQGTIERLAPGSMELGRKLKPFYAAKDIMGLQSEVGRGSQIFNTLKPAFAGLTTGAAAGSFLPGVGNITGALVGGGAAMLANNPRVQGTVGSMLQKGVQMPKIAQKTVGMAKPAVDVGSKAAAMANAIRKPARYFAPDQQQPQQQQQESRPTQTAPTQFNSPEFQAPKKRDFKSEISAVFKKKSDKKFGSMFVDRL